MIRRLVVILAVAVIALLAYNYFTTGKIGLMPGVAMGEQEREIDDLIQQARQAATRYKQAARAAGLSGIDTTADADAATRQLDAVQEKARELKRNATEETKASLSRLDQEITLARQEIGAR